MTEGALRKSKSHLILKAENVPLLETLPEVETEVESLRRTEQEVVYRAIAITIVAVKGETADHSLAQKLTSEFGAHDFYSPKEREFIEDPTPTKQSRINFSWKYECAFVLLWALGFADSLYRPDRICDVPWIANLLKAEGTQGLLSKSNLRSQCELLDAADLIYRYHWAVRDATLNGRDAPSQLILGVVQERHHALNWLIGYYEAEWDDVPTDT